MHLTITPFWFEWWKLWAERDYRIPNTDCLVVPTPQASVGVLEHMVLYYILFLAWDGDGFSAYNISHTEKVELNYKQRIAEFPNYRLICGSHALVRVPAHPWTMLYLS